MPSPPQPSQPLLCGRVSCPAATELVTQVAVGVILALIGTLVPLTVGDCTARIAIACLFLFANAVICPLAARLVADALRADPGPSPYTRMTTELADKI